MSEFANFEPEPTRTPPLAPEDLCVRVAEEADLEAAATLVARREGDPIERWREILQQALRRAHDPSQSLLLVGEVDQQIVAYARADRFVSPSDAPVNCAPAGWYLTGIVVASTHRRRGSGRALTRARLSHVFSQKNKAYYFANARNRVSIALHEELGFQELTRDFWYPHTSFEGGIGVLFRCVAGRV